jgi:hypothetical protein
VSVHFYDATEPANVPSGVHAAVYINGRYAWPEEEIRRMSRIFRISVNPDPKWAEFARCIDVEQGDAWPVSAAIPFLAARWRRNGDATAYCNRSTLPTLQALVERAGIRVLYWVATLDGTMSVPGAWAVQYQGGMTAPYDLSILYGINNFVRP